MEASRNEAFGEFQMGARGKFSKRSLLFFSPLLISLLSCRPPGATKDRSQAGPPGCTAHKLPPAASRGHRKPAQSLQSRSTQYPECEGIHKDRRVQPLAPRRTTQNSNPMSENIVQTLLKLRQPGAVTARDWGACSMLNKRSLKRS